MPHSQVNYFSFVPRTTYYPNDVRQITRRSCRGYLVADSYQDIVSSIYSHYEDEAVVISFYLYHALKFQLVRHDTFHNGQNQQDSTECLLMLINIIHKGPMSDSSSTTYPMRASLSDILFSFVLEKYIVCDVCGLRPSHLSLVVCYIFHLLIPLLGKTWFYKDCNRNCKNPVLDVIRTLGTSNQAIYYNLLNIYFSSLIDLETLIIMSSKIDVPYLWIRPLDLVPLNLAYGQQWIIMDRQYIPVIILHLSIVAKNPIILQRSHNYGVWNYWQQNLLSCICNTIWIDWNMIVGLQQKVGSLIAPMALARPLHHIDNRSRNRRRNLWVGWCVSSWWPLFPSRSSVLLYIYICIFYMSSVFFGLPIVSWW